MEIRVNTPDDWDKFVVPLRYKGIGMALPASLKYTTALDEGAALVRQWRIYFLLSKKRMPQRKREKYERLNKEYMRAVNKIADFIHKQATWAALSQPNFG